MVTDEHADHAASDSDEPRLFGFTKAEWDQITSNAPSAGVFDWFASASQQGGLGSIGIDLLVTVAETSEAYAARLGATMTKQHPNWRASVEAMLASGTLTGEQREGWQRVLAAIPAE